MQVYIVSGGWGTSNLASTVTLDKDGGSAWQVVASLPSGRHTVKGVGLDNGRFMVTGEFWTIFCKIINYNVALQVVGLAPPILTTCSCTTPKRTSGPQWVISPQPAAGMA